MKCCCTMYNCTIYVNNEFYEFAKWLWPSGYFRRPSAIPASPEGALPSVRRPTGAQLRPLGPAHDRRTGREARFRPMRERHLRNNLRDKASLQALQRLGRHRLGRFDPCPRCPRAFEMLAAVVVAGALLTSGKAAPAQDPRIDALRRAFTRPLPRRYEFLARAPGPEQQTTTAEPRYSRR